MQQAIYSSKMDTAASLPAAICVVVFPLHCLLLMPSFLSHFLCSFCVCTHDILLHQMHFSGSAPFTVSVTIFATPGNYYAKITAHSISIKCAKATFSLSLHGTVQPVCNVKLPLTQSCTARTVR